MNSHAAEVITLLKAHVTGVVGISPSPVPPQPAFPYVTVAELRGDEVQSLTGVSGLNRTIIQIDIWDKTHETAWNMREAIKSYLLPFKGTAGTQTIRLVTFNVENMFYDGNRSLHQAVVRLFIWWSN